MGNLRAEMELRFSGLLWVVLVAILGVSTPSGEEAHLGPIDEAVSLISLDNQQADAGPEEAKAPDYGDDSPKNDGADAYTKIPNFVFQHMAEPVSGAQTLHDCQKACNKLPQCRSFSFRAPSAADQKDSKDTTAPEGAKEKAEDDADGKTLAYLPAICMWSMESIRYNSEWIFYTKAKDVDWEGKPHLTTENFHAFPGLEYQESSYAQQKDTKLTPCMTKCAADPKCEAFSFNQEEHLCRHAGAGVHYDRTFTYYEKRQSPQSSPAKEPAAGELESNADELSAQEKSSKKSVQNMISVTRARTEKRETRELRMERVKRNSDEAIKKAAVIEKAEGKLTLAKNHLAHIQNAISVKQEFDRSYFNAMGAAHEKKTKEVKLKNAEIKQKDQLAAKESYKKTGEVQAKVAKSIQERKIEDAEIGIQTTKEKIMKISNAKLKRSLDAQASQIAGMGGAEGDSLESIKEKHRTKIAQLQGEVYTAKSAVTEAQALLVQKRVDLNEMKARDNEDAKSQKGAFLYDKKKLQALTDAKIKAIQSGI